MDTPDFPKNYFLVSMTCVVDNKRKFMDIPMYSHKLVFPSRMTMYGFLCDRLGVKHDNMDLYNSFAVIGIYKFECKEDFDNYLTMDTAPAEDTSDKLEVEDE